MDVLASISLVRNTSKKVLYHISTCVKDTVMEEGSLEKMWNEF